MNSYEIAKLANVSRATVSHVLNGHPNVSQKTREKVEAVMREYNYFPNEAARKLVSKRSYFLAIFLIDFSSKPGELTIMRNPFFHEFVGYAIDIVNKSGYNLVTTIIRKDNLNSIDKLFQSGSIDGGIILGDILGQDTLANLASNSYPIALCHQIRRSPAPNLMVVNVDNYLLGKAAADILLEHGHKRIAHITGESFRIAVQDRLDGFVNGLTAGGVCFDAENYLEYGEFYSSNSAYETCMKFLERNRGQLPTAIFLASPMMLSGTIQAINDFGLRIPQDISILVMDDANIENVVHNPISSVSVSPEAYVKLAVEKLIKLAAGEKMDKLDFSLEEYSYIDRGSVLDIR